MSNGDPPKVALIPHMVFPVFFSEPLFPAISPAIHHLVILSNNDDWQALFKDGVLVEQAHEIVPADLAKYVPIASITYEEMPLDVVRHLYRVGDFPGGFTLEEARAYTSDEE